MRSPTRIFLDTCLLIAGVSLWWMLGMNTTGRVGAVHRIGCQRKKGTCYFFLLRCVHRSIHW